MAEADYSGRSMAQKLGVKEGSLVALVDAPPGWTIAGAPSGARVKRGTPAGFEVAVWFVRSLHDLRAGLKKMAGATRPWSATLGPVNYLRALLRLSRTTTSMRAMS